MVLEVRTAAQDIGMTIRGFLHEIAGFPESNNDVPLWMDDYISRAVQLKRNRNYEDAVKIYIDLVRTSGTVYASLMISLYKTVASAGYLAEGLRLLEIGKRIYDSNPSELTALYGLPSNYDFHLHSLLQAVRSRSQLIAYLKAISGNLKYQLERDYVTMVTELVHYLELRNCVKH